MSRRYRFTTITGANESIHVIHCKAISYLESYKSEEGVKTVKIVMNSGHTLYASGSLKEVMAELYGQSLTGAVRQLYQAAACFLRKLFRKQA